MELPNFINQAFLEQQASLKYGRVHFGQLGEDCILWQWFHTKRQGFYVDVGCHDPARYSNTYLLHHHLGWSGINIDADLRAITKFQAARPSDINVHVGIGLASGEVSFMTFEDGAVNTFDPDLAKRQSGQFGQPTAITVPILPLAEVLMRYLPRGAQIDYLNTDCEGRDHEVLLSNDWEVFRPQIVTVEIFDLPLESSLTNNSVAFMKSVGYRLVSYVDVTAFFRRID